MVERHGNSKWCFGVQRISVDLDLHFTGLDTAQVNLSNALDNVLRIRASSGTRAKELDTLNESGDNMGIQYKQQLSDLQDVDYAKAISDLTRQQTYLQATQQAFLKVQGLSLFDYLK